MNGNPVQLSQSLALRKSLVDENGIEVFQIGEADKLVDGGTGIGKAINGGFGMVLDGSERVDTILKAAMPFDTMIGVSRRSWARNENAIGVAAEYNEANKGKDHITLPYIVDEKVVSQIDKLF